MLPLTSQRNRSSATLAALVTTLSMIGCGSDAGGAASAAGGATGGETVDASRTDDFAIRQPRDGAEGHLRIAILQATPAPPARDLNNWLIEVTAPEGEPPSDCTLGVGLFMPAHGHAATTKPEIRPGDAPGRFQVDAMNLSMPGRWEITFDLACGGVTDQVVFDVEIPR